MIFRKKQLEPVATRFVISILKFALSLLLILILMYSIGIEITGFTTMISAIVLAVGMALKENIANLANGIILVSSQKYKQGDLIKIKVIRSTGATLFGEVINTN